MKEINFKTSIELIHLNAKEEQAKEKKQRKLNSVVGEMKSTSEFTY